METITATIDGLEVTINRTALQDFRVFDVLAGMESSDTEEALEAAKRVPWMARRIFGAEQLEKILQHIEKQDGYADTARVMRFIGAAFSVARVGSAVASSPETLKN